jgi:hypothetical protein
LQFEQNAEMPKLDQGTPAAIWNAYFSNHRPAPALVSRWVMTLNEQKQYEQVIACLRSALIHGQAQPWMYEVLALTMEIQNYPKEDIERVVLSLTDFGQVDYASMMYSGAYLTRFGRKAAALRLYKQASRMLPERAEPYLLGLKLAKSDGTPEDVAWAAEGILLNYWGSEFQARHQEAEAALLDQAAALLRAGDQAQAARLQEGLKQARSRDLRVRLEWSGSADLDMQVEEPGGSICSIALPETAAGGIFLHDGVGPNPKNSYELYLCPRGPAGPYRVSVRNAGGTLVGDRATLTVTMDEGLADQTSYSRVLSLNGESAGLTIDLPHGRRVQPRAVAAELGEAGFTEESLPRKRAGRDARAERVKQDFLKSRESSAVREDPRRGAVGYAPVIRVIPEGSSLRAAPTVSADRRYVRFGLQPAFSDIVDVFTFSYLNGGAAQPAAPRR